MNIRITAQPMWSDGTIGHPTEDPHVYEGETWDTMSIGEFVARRMEMWNTLTDDDGAHCSAMDIIVEVLPS